ncbi:hypothetical protein K1719_028167 [Acacia pycnantha]|nr:hypothetical protein K1719_028167 [Acacia pycnantha]
MVAAVLGARAFDYLVNHSVSNENLLMVIVVTDGNLQKKLSDLVECPNNYCYDCGKIGHEARNCKVPNNDSEEDDSERSVGNGLGTPHVRTIEDALVVHDQKWDETAILKARPPPRAETAGDWWRKRDPARYGNSFIHGAPPAIHLLNNVSISNGQELINESVNAHVQQGIHVCEIPKNMETMSGIPVSSQKLLPIQLPPPIMPAKSGSVGILGGSPDPSTFHGINSGNGQEIIPPSIAPANSRNIGALGGFPAPSKLHGIESSNGQEVSAPPLFQGFKSGNSQKCSPGFGNSLMQKEILINENHSSKQPMRDYLIPPPSSLYPPLLSPSEIPPPNNPQTGIHSYPPNRTCFEQIAQPNILPYSVEFPDPEADQVPTPLPLAGLSPISAVTNSLNLFHLKRCQDHPLEDELVLNPTKKRLLFLEPGPSPVPNQLNQSPTPKAQRISHRKIKGTMRSNKSKCKIRMVGLPPSVESSSSVPLGTQATNYNHNSSLDLDSPNTADGCHQAAIGSP